MIKMLDITNNRRNYFLNEEAVSPDRITGIVDNEGLVYEPKA